MIDMQVLKARAAARLQERTQTADVANPANWLTPAHAEAQPISQLATLASAAECDAPADDQPDPAPTAPSTPLSSSAAAVAGTLEWLEPVTGGLDVRNLTVALGWRLGEVWAALRELQQAGLARRGRDLAWRLRMRQEELAPTPASSTTPPSCGATGGAAP